MTYDINLILQKKYAIEILQTVKKREYRDFSDFYIERFFEECEASDLHAVEIPLSKRDKKYLRPKKIERIRFQVGYSKKYFIIECAGWGMFTKQTCRNLTDFAVNRSYSNEECEYKGAGKSLHDVVREEYDIEYMPENEPFFIFELGGVLEDKSELIINS